MRTRGLIKSAGLNIDHYITQAEALVKELKKIKDGEMGSERYARKKAQEALSIFEHAREEERRIEETKD